MAAAKGREIRWIEDARRLFAPALTHAASGDFQIAYLDQARRVVELADEAAGPLPVPAILRRAVQLGASALMVAHSHGEGDPAPRPEDIHLTRRLIEIGRELEVEVHDHLIFAGDRWISFRRLGLL